MVSQLPKNDRGGKIRTKMDETTDFTTPIVSALQNEYNSVFERTHSIDTRASILLSVLSTILPLYLGVLNWTNIRNALCTNCISFKQFAMIIFFFLSVATLIIAFIFCIVTIRSRRYSAFPTDNYVGFNLNEHLEINTTVNQINTSLIIFYVNCIRENTITVTKKAGKFIGGLITTGIYILLSIVTILFNLI